MASENVSFNLQTFLSEMREEQQRNLANLELKVDLALDRINNHETRIVVVENTRKRMMWLGGVMIAGLLGTAFDFAANHLPRFFASTNTVQKDKP